MSQDLAFRAITFSDGSGGIDLAISMGDFVADEGLETAVLCSFYCDSYVPPEEVPDGFVDPKGWWGDSISQVPMDKFGSKFWLLDRGKLTTKTKNELKDYALQALQWLIDEGIAEKITASTEIEGNLISLSVKIYKPSGDDIPFKFLWDGQALRKA